MNDVTTSLGDAIATQGVFLQGWVMVLVGTHLISLLLSVYKQDGKFKIRYESLAIVGSFFVAGASISWLYEQVGYVRLLGLPHLIFWTPVFVWVLSRALKGQYSAPFKQYVYLYLTVAGVSLAIDTLDVVRYLLGDT
ncbi:MAG: hypothetical protein ACKVKL_02555 [Pseudomonadales bacterium]|jgi:hypothetical protein|tara:strand:+ start:219 stop:629 length:411 start_codon:yes stop_codon:yes gene_type:complete